jgi:hypothetical protein
MRINTIDDFPLKRLKYYPSRGRTRLSATSQNYAIHIQYRATALLVSLFLPGLCAYFKLIIIVLANSTL